MNDQEWLDANQKLLVAEFARLRAILGGGDAANESQAIESLRASLETPPAIDRLAEAFSLSEFERDIVLLCAGVVMDSELARLCMEAQREQGLRGASFGLALAALPAPHWSALAPTRPLRRYRLLDLGSERTLTARQLTLNERVLHYLTGVHYVEPVIALLLEPLPAVQNLARSHESLAACILDSLGDLVEAPVVQLAGDDTSAQYEVSRRVASELGLSLRSLRARDLPGTVEELESLAVAWRREARLLNSALLINVAAPDVEVAARFIKQAGGPIFVASPSLDSLELSASRFTVNRPDALEQKHLWQAALGDLAQELNGSLDAVAGQFRLTTSEIAHAASRIDADASDHQTLSRSLWRQCRESARRRLDELSQRIEPTARWEELVLPQAQLMMLKQVSAYVRQRLKVHESWGFADKSRRGLGVAALFAGESGTGKTMAAEVLARELSLDLYRIDLSAMVSKYIGETEKNLRRVFDAAEDSGAILLFDEADALFGKRSEVKDSHDRYANIEVSYLLQRMEAYRGLAILTTNLKGALDTAFQRRLRFVIQFPFPDAALREKIWRGVFPSAAPVESIDHRRLAQLNVTGGNIRNIALTAAFLAAESDSAIDMSHLLQAARAESAKRERPFSEAETRGWQ